MRYALHRQAITPILLGLSLLSLLWYASFLYDTRNMGHPVAYGLLVVADTFGMLQLLGAWVTMLFARSAYATPESLRMRRALERLKGGDMPPSVVAVLIPVAGEPLSMIRETVIAARDMEVSHRTVILDDGASDAVRSLAQELSVEYIRREHRRGEKAGNLNHALSLIKTDFFAVFDSDYLARPQFLLETLPHLLSDRKLAFVQTPQYYGNREHFISGGDAETQEVFYTHIQTGKNAFNAAFFVGTNALFRRAAIEDIGGFFEDSHSEDIWTSLFLHERGWKSLFLPQVLAVGDAPRTVDAFFRQQFRWARGGFEIFFKRNPLLQTLSLDQKLQYLHSVSFYFGGFAVFLFYLLPLLYVYFGWRPLTDPEGTLHWALRFLPYYLMTFLLTIHLLGHVPRWRTFVVALSAFPAHIAACLSVLTGLKFRWSVTGVIRRRADYITSVAPHLFFLLLSLGALPILALESDDPVLAALMAFWLLWNSSILASLCIRALGRVRVSAPAIGFSAPLPA